MASPVSEHERYQRYLAGREWGLLKRAVRERCNGTCERCRHFPLSHVHHLTYARKYHERPDDLQGLCEGCHKFVHGLSDRDPKADVPVKVLGRVVKSVYLAGKITKGYRGDWRTSIISDNKDGYPSSSYVDRYWSPDPSIVVSLSDGRVLSYTGPFFDGPGHGCVIDYKHASYSNHRDLRIPNLCTQAIRRSDLVFAWIDSQDCFGTLAEIGFARAIGKLIFIAGPAAFPELWFSYALSDLVNFGRDDASDVFSRMILDPDSFETFDEFNVTECEHGNHSTWIGDFPDDVPGRPVDEPEDDSLCASCLRSMTDRCVDCGALSCNEHGCSSACDCDLFDPATPEDHDS